ncbi:urea ABC transporter permease subunit UrtC [Puniceicoccus vermicola]|uniref:Urea ABC transporter permease subunit UrtC n=1 Tax=Puniceicoccus vermicola TaxID=388746 RepID=A0A7X1B1Z9_9BACT|nr:urea ABC transporter permease subunit UrtC [Puniceicoccus vermicola]MBC2604077.1 urea ABC transporter permease subunit UrtC [Puniceicoccus vermicola]
MTKISESQRSLIGIIIVTLIVVVAMPMLNAFGSESSFFFVSDYQLNLWGKYLCYAGLAVSLNLLWGYTGLLCLGQGLFFALGGYALGMHLMLKIGEQGAYKSELPDFMVFLGYKELPAHWVPFDSFGFAVFAVLLVPGIVAGIFGFLAFRARIKGVYFAIITQALTYAACLMFFQNSFTFGGNNGFTDFKTILGSKIFDPVTQRTLFTVTAVYLSLCLFFIWWLTRTKFGKIQRAIRDSENRVRFSGYSTTTYKLAIFVVAAIMAGIVGALYVPQVGIINPEEMRPSKSLEIVVWVAVGGRATILGPVIGAVFVNWLKSYSTYHYPDYWLIILGALFVFVVLFMPNGIVGLPQQLKSSYKRYRHWFQKNKEAESAA